MPCRIWHFTKWSKMSNSFPSVNISVLGRATFYKVQQRQGRWFASSCAVIPLRIRKKRESDFWADSDRRGNGFKLKEERQIRYQEEILCCEGAGALTQAAQRSSGWPIHGSVQGQVEWGWESDDFKIPSNPGFSRAASRALKKQTEKMQLLVFQCRCRQCLTSVQCLVARHSPSLGATLP